MNKKTFKTTDSQGNDLELAVRRTTVQEKINSQLAYNNAWSVAEKKGSLVHCKLDEVAERQGLWGESQRKRVNELEQLITSSERKLRGGANSLASIDEGKALALEIRRLRNERLELLLAKNNLYQYTAEYHADTARINYILSVVTINSTNGAAYFPSTDAFVDQKESDLVRDALQAYAELMQSDVPDEVSTLYENTWLLKYKFVDSKYRLVDKEGHLVSEDGLLVDEEGRYIDASGEYVDKSGNRVDKDGNFVVDYAEFPDV